MIQQNFVKLLESSCRDNWDRVALRDYTTKYQLTYGELGQEITKLHILFDKYPISKGDKIALCGKNSVQWGVAYLAAITYGAVIVPILDEFSPYDVTHIINHSDSRILFCDADIWKRLVADDMDGINCVIELNKEHDLLYCANDNIQGVLDGLDNEIKLRYSHGFNRDDLHFAQMDNSELMAICYTAGTTSFTKGVMLSYNNFAGNIMFGLNNYASLGVKLERSLCVLPLAHTYPMSFTFLIQIAAGAEITLLGRIPSPNIITEACKEVQPTLHFFVPLILEKIYKVQIAPLMKKWHMKILMKTPGLNTYLYRKIGRRVYNALGGKAVDIIVGGAAMNPDIEAFFYKTKLPFTVGYGMTECAPLISYIHNPDFIPTSVGKVIKDFLSIKIQKESYTDSTGEVLVKGENVMMGYYKDPKATSKAFTKDGWLRTGDVGKIDKQGNIYLSGRIKTVLLSSNGENIYPEVIESKLENMPLISECIIIQNDNKLEAWVYPDQEAITKLNLSEKDVVHTIENNRKSLNERVAKFERISVIRLTSMPFPKTPKKTIKRDKAFEIIREFSENNLEKVS